MIKKFNRFQLKFALEALVFVCTPILVYVLALAHGFGVSTIRVPARSSSAVAGVSTEHRNTVLLTEPQTALLKAINDTRLSAGVQPVLIDEELQQVAQERHAAMVRDGFYAHKSPGGLSYLDYLNQSFNFSCENLNMSFDNLPSNTIDAWLESSTGHRECLLSPDVVKIGVDSALFQQETNQYLTTLILASAR